MAKKARVKINYTKKDLLSWQEIEEICQDSEMLTAFVDDFKTLFEQNFYLSDEETRQNISMIIANCPENKMEQVSSIIQSLADLDKDKQKFFADENALLALVYQPNIFKELGEEPISGTTEQERKQEVFRRIENFTDEQKQKFLKRLSEINVEQRRQEARKMVKKIIDIAVNSVRNDQTILPRDFYPILKQAKVLGIDHTAWVTTTNLKKMQNPKFNDLVFGLLEEYKNPFYKENSDEPKTFKPFMLEDLSTILQASTLLSLFRADGVQPLINIIGNVLKEYEGAKSSDLVAILNTFPTILTVSPRVIAENIEKFSNRCVGSGRMTKSQFAQEIIKKPSILVCDPEKIEEFEELYSLVSQDIIDKYHVEVEDDYVKKQVEKVCYDFKQFDKINGLKGQKIQQLEKVGDALVSQLGAKNALTLMGDFNVLNANPDYITYIFSMAKYVQAKVGKRDKNLVKYIAENTAQFFGRTEDSDPIAKMQTFWEEHPREKKARTIARPKIDSTKAAELTKIEDVDLAYKKLSNDERKRADATVLALIEFAKSEEKKKTSFDRANQISDERIEELMREAEVSCIDEDGALVEIMTRFNAIYDEQNGEGSAERNTGIQDFIQGYKRFRAAVERLDLDTVSEFAKCLKSCIIFMNDLCLYQTHTQIPPEIEQKIQYMDEHRRDVLKTISMIYGEIDGDGVINRQIKHVNVTGASKYAKMDIATSIVLSNIIKYVHTYFPDRSEMILPESLLDAYYEEEPFETRFVQLCTVGWSVYQSFSNAVSGTPLSRLDKKMSLENLSLTPRKGTSSLRAHEETLQNLRSFLTWRDMTAKMAPTVDGLTDIKRRDFVFTNLIKNSIEFCVEDGFVVYQTFFPSKRDAALMRSIAPLEELGGREITHYCSNKDNVEGAGLLTSVRGDYVKYLVDKDKNPGGDGK